MKEKIDAKKVGIPFPAIFQVVFPACGSDASPGIIENKPVARPGKNIGCDDLERHFPHGRLLDIGRIVIPQQ
ncbi:MAG: hypothetical protein NTW95_15530, partial [Candidatus Aminicenantes bacterium]|nr:hypothetical protein [Candidatus Aminicenantes bacterium]